MEIHVISIRTGGKDVVDSKTFISLGLGETSITLGQGGEALNFVFDFIAVEGSDQKINVEKSSDKSLRIILTNWNSSLGTTLIEPIHVGTFSNRKLYLLFAISKIGQKGELREVTFTAYVGDEVKDGQD
jgi:hypothetical protein